MTVAIANASTTKRYERQALRAARAISVCLFLTALVVAPANSEDSKETSLLIIQGTVTAAIDEKIALSVPPIAISFTDRPHRSVGPVVLETYVKERWTGDETFRQVPPNASLIDEKMHTVAVIEIYDLELDDTVLDLHYNLLDGKPPMPGAVIALTIDSSLDVNLKYKNRSDDEDDPSTVEFKKNKVTNP